MDAWRTGKSSGAQSVAVKSIVERLNSAFEEDQQQSQKKMQIEKDAALKKIQEVCLLGFYLCVCLFVYYLCFYIHIYLYLSYLSVVKNSLSRHQKQ